VHAPGGCVCSETQAGEARHGHWLRDVPLVCRGGRLLETELAVLACAPGEDLLLLTRHLSAQHANKLDEGLLLLYAGAQIALVPLFTRDGSADNGGV